MSFSAQGGVCCPGCVRVCVCVCVCAWPRRGACSCGWQQGDASMIRPGRSAAAHRQCLPA
eukprot:3451627-Rhodomonas_salina.1